jgi:hypothetical protein
MLPSHLFLGLPSWLFQREIPININIPCLPNPRHPLTPQDTWVNWFHCRIADKGWYSGLGIGRGITMPHSKETVFLEMYTGPPTWTDSFERLKQRKMGMRFGTCNDRSLYRTGSIKTVCRKLSKYKLDIEAAELSLEGCGLGRSSLCEPLLRFVQAHKTNKQTKPVTCKFHIYWRQAAYLWKCVFLSLYLCSGITTKLIWASLICFMSHFYFLGAEDAAVHEVFSTS